MARSRQVDARAYVTTKEELARLNERVATALRRGIRESGEPLSVIAGWAGVSPDSMRNYISDEPDAQRIPLGRALLIIRRGRGFVRSNMVKLFEEIIRQSSPEAGE